MRALRSVFLVLPLLAGCFGGDDTEQSRPVLPLETPNSFLVYPNAQAPLAAGDYEIVAATDVAAQSGSYRLLITHDDGRSEVLTGAWTASGGASAVAAGNPRHPLTLARAGGIRIELESAVDGYLFLVRNGQVVASDSGSGPSGHALIFKPLSLISSASYGEAYYAAVDPEGERTTLADWKARNGFGQPGGVEGHVVFRDAFDLGYGRDMYYRRGTDGRIAIFVDNYVVRVEPGSSANYGPINVEAAIDQDRRFFQGTNAIEFSPADEDGPSDNGSIAINKFFTFDASGRRIASADLDGRGVKHMPGMCWACHGGQTLPLNPDGSFPAQSLRSAKLNLLDVSLFDYSARAGFRRSDQESALRLLNQYVAESYAVMGARDINNAAINAGQWNSAFAEDLYGGRYHGLTHDDTAVPPGWQEKAGRPDGVAHLYKTVIEPHCIACHSLQGTSVGEGITVTVGGEQVSLANAINFSSYEKFISFRERIIDYVYRRGIMPMSLRNFERFWREPEQGPALLASYLSEPTLFDSSGRVIRPGHPVARPGASRRVKAEAGNVVQLDGAASHYAASYEWQIVGGPGGASLQDASTARPRLVVPGNGSYVLALTVRNGFGSDTRQQTITVDSALAKSPTQLTFADDVLPLLESYGTTTCITCHSLGGSTGGYKGIPVTWTRDAGLYRRVMARVDLRDAENSKLLIKPTSLMHGGGQLINTAVPADKDVYDTLVSWIRAGAVCGTDAAIGCP